jgi:hypothetical protein
MAWGEAIRARATQSRRPCIDTAALSIRQQGLSFGQPSLSIRRQSRRLTLDATGLGLTMRMWRGLVHSPGPDRFIPEQGGCMRRTELTKQTARQKGYAAMGSASLTVLFVFMVSPWFLLAGGPATAWLTYRWLQYRAEWGLRF